MLERRANYAPYKHYRPARTFTFDGVNISEVTKDMHLVTHIDMGFGIYARPKLALARINMPLLDEDQTKIRRLLEGKQATVVTRRFTRHSNALANGVEYEAEVLISHPDIGNNVNVSDYLVQQGLAWYLKA